MTDTGNSNPHILHAPQHKPILILDLDESPAYTTLNTQNNWDLHSPFMEFKDWGDVEVESWGPRDFVGHCWGGVYTCQIEVHWPLHDSSIRLYRVESYYSMLLHH